MVLCKKHFVLVGLTALLGACSDGGSGETFMTNPNGTGPVFMPGDTGDSGPILGAWYDDGILGDSTFVFFKDGTYAHVFQSEDIDDKRGLEWGTYFRNGSSGVMSAVVEFDENDDAGLSAFGRGVISVNTYSDLSVQVEHDYQDAEGVFRSGLGFWGRIGNEGIQGAWRSADTSTQMSMLSFSENDVYIHARVDQDTSAVTTGAEKGTYTWDDVTGELVVALAYDENDIAGLSDYSSSAIFFASATNNILTLIIDTDGNGVADETMDFVRE